MDRAHAVKLEEGEYFISDIIGLNVVTDEGTDLGVITDVLQTGANDVYVVEMKNGREVLLPVIDECVLDICLEEKKVLVHVMKGFLEE